MLRSSITTFILASFTIHLIFMASLHFTKKSKVKPKSETVEISYITTKKKKTLQIVQQNKKAINDEIPEKEAFLSRHNQRVKKQTRAAKTGKFINSNNGNPLANNQSKKQNKSPEKTKIKDLVPQFNISKMVEKSNEAKRKIKQTANSGRRGQASQTDDHLKNVAVGIETVLNSREFLYYAYYSRIKEKIRQHWGTKIRAKIQKLIQGGRSIASNNDRITKVIIVLNKRGTLVGVKVLGKSGIRDLDDAAVEAFREAAPFPNPPRGMVERDGTVKIHWDFILEAKNKEVTHDQNYIARRKK